MNRDSVPPFDVDFAQLKQRIYGLLRAHDEKFIIMEALRIAMQIADAHEHRRSANVVPRKSSSAPPHVD